METNFQLFDAESKFGKIQSSHFQGGGWGVLVETNFQLLLLSPNLLKSKVPISRGGGGGGWNQFPTFNAESKFAKKKKNFFGQKCAWEWFWSLSTKWFACMRTTKIGQLQGLIKNFSQGCASLYAVYFPEQNSCE